MYAEMVQSLWFVSRSNIKCMHACVCVCVSEWVSVCVCVCESVVCVVHHASVQLCELSAAEWAVCMCVSESIVCVSMSASCVLGEEVWVCVLCAQFHVASEYPGVLVMYYTPSVNQYMVLYTLASWASARVYYHTVVRRATIDPWL